MAAQEQETLHRTNLAPELSTEIVRRVTEIAQPDRIILFGSAARGQMSPDSDVDLLVVKSGVQHRRRLAQQIHRNFFGLGVAIDVIVVSPEDLARQKDSVGTIVSPALAEGHEIYAQADDAAIGEGVLFANLIVRPLLGIELRQDKFPAGVGL
jgi:predicted nucleotidyltransferase